MARFYDIAAQGLANRSAELRELDAKRVYTPDWFQKPHMLGYSAYADRFGGTLDGVRQRLSYLSDLGVTYLHLMPVTCPREGESDGGYAVADYERIDPRLGTMQDLEALASACRKHGISLVSDLALNHTADTHEWAQAARAGDPVYQAIIIASPTAKSLISMNKRWRMCFPPVRRATSPISPKWISGSGPHSIPINGI
ncbi:hypothetical protein JCM17843_00900 [Kordiimonadales bacterium JCM 17843]|nr:hypothetical protein JCM17843_00900 [Kordiimonadales bacterium JCM 17843]